jgi:hypothetical protein
MSLILATYPVDDILSQVKSGCVKKYVFDGVTYQVKMYSRRYQVFKINRTCVACGLIGTEMSLCAVKHSRSAHFNLYGYDAQGNRILFTQDHIVPVSKGGKDNIDNLRTMCLWCNVARGNHINISLDIVRQLSDNLKTSTNKRQNRKERWEAHLKLKKEQRILKRWYKRLVEAREQGKLPPRVPGSAVYRKEKQPQQVEQEKTILKKWLFRLRAAREKGLIPLPPQDLTCKADTELVQC